MGDLDDRKAAILSAIVEQYIETDQPVGSGRIVARLATSVSSATVRNEMAALEHEGFLHQPHTSAGRVPTEKGYRHFVDHLRPGGLTGPDAQRVRDFFDQAHGEVEAVLQETSALLAGLTSLAAVVVPPGNEAARCASAQLVPLTPTMLLLVTVSTSGSVDKHTVISPVELSEDQLDDVRRIVAETLVGECGSDVLTIARRSGDAVVDDVAGAAVAVACGGHDERIYVGGASAVVEQFDAIESVSRVLRILEEEYAVIAMLRELLDRGLSVAIGSETGLEPLADCSVVLAPYDVEGQPAGTIGVLGPTRMNYPQALAAVGVVSRRLGRSLSDD